MFKSFPFIDFEDINAIAFTVLKENNQYNLMMDMLYINTDSEDYDTEYGYTTRTTKYSENLVELAVAVQSILDLGIYDNLIFLEESRCFDEDGETSFEFSWDDYLSTGATLN